MATPAETIALLQTQSLPAMVRHELERRILAGELPPGTKLNEADIAEELKVSRSPVREGFRLLEQAGLVRTEKNRGVFVRELTHFEADEIYEVRAGFDAMIGQLAAERCTPAQVDELRKLVRGMEKAGKKRSVDEYYPLNIRFHDLLAGFTGNATLLAAYRRLVNELHLYRRETLAHGEDNFAHSTQEHAAIVEAVARGDAGTASRLLHDHAIESRERLHRMLERDSIALPRPAAQKRKPA